MALVIHPTFDYQPNDTSALKWDEAPPAPDDFKCVLSWDDGEWDKSYGGRVWAPDVRDSLFDNFGVFGTFQTPLLLDHAGFRKLCYLIVGDNYSMEDYADGKYDLGLFVSTKLPKNYLPFDFCDDPLGWAWRQFRIREAKRQRGYLKDIHFAEEGDTMNVDAINERLPSRREELLEDDLFVDMAGHLVKSNDQVRLVNYSETELNGTIGTVYCLDPQDRCDHVTVYMPSISEDTAISISIHNLRKFILKGTDLPQAPRSLTQIVDWSKMPLERNGQEEKGKEISLCDLSTDTKQHIASYLGLSEVEENLRPSCRDTFWNFRKPPPENVEYDFIYFSGTNCWREQWHGVAHTTNDVFEAIKNYDWKTRRDRKILVSLKFIKFDRSHSIVPLFNYEYVGEQNGIEGAEFDPLGCYYCGVEQASHVELHGSTVYLDDLDDPGQMEHTSLFSVFRYCKNWTPREPCIQLQHFGIRKTDCEDCGEGQRGCTCSKGPGGDSGYNHRIYYSPEWFKHSDGFIRNDSAFSAPSDSHEKSVILFEDFVSLSF